MALRTAGLALCLAVAVSSAAGEHGTLSPTSRADAASATEAQWGDAEGGGGGGAVMAMSPTSAMAGGTAAAPVVRRLQPALANETSNSTRPYVSPCEQKVDDEADSMESCQIGYMKNDCPRPGKSQNWVPWVDLEGGVYFLHIFGVLVMFLSLSVVCDEFFVPGALALPPFTPASLAPPCPMVSGVGERHGG